MSAESVLGAAVAAALRAEAGLSALNGVFEGPPGKATPPYAEIGEVLGIDWSVKDRPGRELRALVTIRDAAEGSARAATLGDAAGAAVEGLPRVLGGWDVASVVLVRSRLAGTAPGRWTAAVEYRVRMLARE